MPYATQEKRRDNYKKVKHRLNARKRDKYKENPEKHKKRHKDFAKSHPSYQRDYQKRQRTLILSHYSNGTIECKCCGERTLAFLNLDHTNGEGNKHRREGKRGGALYNWLIKNNFPAGFQVMCFNCNCGRSVNGGVCPHQQC